MTVATFIAVRKLKRKSQEEYARELGISRGMVAQIETKRKRLSERLASKVIAVYGAEYVDAVNEVNDMK